MTGIYLLGAYDQMLPMIRAYMPKARVLGTVYVPAEVNMVYQQDLLRRRRAPAASRSRRSRPTRAGGWRRGAGARLRRASTRSARSRAT